MAYSEADRVRIAKALATALQRAIDDTHKNALKSMVRNELEWQTRTALGVIDIIAYDINQRTPAFVALRDKAMQLPVIKAPGLSTGSAIMACGRVIASRFSRKYSGWKHDAMLRDMLNYEVRIDERGNLWSDA